MQKKSEQVNPIIKRTKAELLNKQSVVSHSIVKNLVLDAMEAMQNAYAPYSNFKVGSALLTRQHKVYKGCNIENASYSPSNCGERTAFFKAISEGEREFVAIAIVGGNLGMITDFCPPCGVCRQVMREFVDPEKFIVILAKNENDYMIYFLEELLPMGFGPENLR
ncbi:MAG TPA: cytidine deaminase [Clostridiales bacterium]|nr:cytidine deaminase [Clostridiales bacterium]